MVEPTSATASAPSGNGKPTLHHLNHSQSQRILWLMCELFPNEPTPPTSYNLVLHKRQPGGKEKTRSPQSLKDVHAMAKSPTLVTPTGQSIIESSAVAKHLIETYDTTGRFGGHDPGSADTYRDSELSSFANASLSLTAMVEMLFQIMHRSSPFFLKPATALLRYGVRLQFTTPELRKMLRFLEARLEESGGDFFLGERLSRADFMLSWPIDLGVARGFVDLEEKSKVADGGRRGEWVYPKLRAWRERCRAREGWRQGMERGGGEGEYDLTLF